MKRKPALVCHRNHLLVLFFLSQPKSAGVLLMGTGGYIFPNSEEHMETACDITENTVLHPFAFRTHTHQLGTTPSSCYPSPDQTGLMQPL